MDILVKSFNRPYYLDRCLRSIYEHVVGDFKIKILDDGTPPTYLTHIQQLYPAVQILRSPQYENKVAAINAKLNQGVPYTQKKIPTSFWIKAVAESTDYFLLLEDDIWLTGEVKLAEIELGMRRDHMALLRLSWQGNQALIHGERKIVDEQTELIIPQIKWWRKLIFTNQFKSRSIGYRLGLFRDIMPYQLPMYVLYAVASAFFSKEYWLYLWQGAGDRVMEWHQLRKALTWYHNPPHKPNHYGKVRTEKAETSYLTSSSNGYADLECDMMLINHLLNQAWLRGELDSMEGWPKDFSLPYLMNNLSTAPDTAALQDEWQMWINRFKSDYRKVGCIVD